MAWHFGATHHRLHIPAAFADRSHRDMAEVLEPEWLCPADESRRRLAAGLAAPGAASALDAVLRLDTHVLMPGTPSSGPTT